MQKEQQASYTREEQSKDPQASRAKEKLLQNKQHFLEKKEDFLYRYVLKNLGLKILSVIIAVIVWFTIVTIEDPYKTREFHVTVEVVNEDALASVNKVYEVVEGNIALVRVRGKKSIIDRLKAEDIRATADLSSLSSVNAVNIVPELLKSVSEEPELECETVFKVSLENMETKQVKVNVITNGVPQDGYSIGETYARPNMLEISGGENVINQIDMVKASVNVNGVSESFHKKVKPVACDSEGNEVESTTLRYGVAKVRVNINVRQTKTIPVVINTSGTPAHGYEYISTECQPQEIQITGERKYLDEIEKVSVPVDITGMKSTSGFVEQNISIQDYLPDNVVVLSDYAQVSLRIVIEKKMSRELTVPVDRIRLLSLAQELIGEVVSPDKEIKLTVEGSSSQIDALRDDPSIYVDCEGLKAGKHQLRVKLDSSYDDVVLRPIRVVVELKTITEEEPATASDTPEPQQTEGTEQEDVEDKDTKDSQVTSDAD